jgi:hypothetical protein
MKTQKRDPFCVRNFFGWGGRSGLRPTRAGSSINRVDSLRDCRPRLVSQQHSRRPDDFASASFLARPCKAESTLDQRTGVGPARRLDPIDYNSEHVFVFDARWLTDLTCPRQLLPCGNNVSCAKASLPTLDFGLAHPEHDVRHIKHRADKFGLCLRAEDQACAQQSGKKRLHSCPPAKCEPDDLVSPA